MKNPFLWLYYTYAQEYKSKPADLDDLIDGLACIRAQQEIEAIYGSE